jgi:hypothetical protein
MVSPVPKSEGPGAPDLYIGYPHPYFGRKILVFFGLQAGLRCNILKTLKFPARYS